MKTLGKHYRVETKWAYQTHWCSPPENEMLTRARANEVMEENRQWPDMNSRIVETRVSVVSQRNRRALTKGELQMRDFNLRQMGVYVPERKSA